MSVPRAVFPAFCTFASAMASIGFANVASVQASIDVADVSPDLMTALAFITTAFAVATIGVAAYDWQRASKEDQA